MKRTLLSQDHSLIERTLTLLLGKIKFIRKFVRLKSLLIKSTISLRQEKVTNFNVRIASKYVIIHRKWTMWLVTGAPYRLLLQT